MDESLYEWALTALSTEGNKTLSDMTITYNEKHDMLLSADQGIIDSDEIAVYEGCRTFIHYVMHMKANVNEYAMEFDLQMLARFLSISIYIFLPTDEQDVFEVNNTRTVDFYTVIHPFDYISQKYITVVRNGNHYEPAMINTAGCVWKISNNVRQISQEEFNSSKNSNTIFYRIRELQKTTQNKKIERNYRINIYETY